jgi:hypothetical protein
MKWLNFNTLRFKVQPLHGCETFILVPRVALGVIHVQVFQTFKILKPYSDEYI